MLLPTQALQPDEPHRPDPAASLSARPGYRNPAQSRDLGAPDLHPHQWPSSSSRYLHRHPLDAVDEVAHKVIGLSAFNRGGPLSQPREQGAQLSSCQVRPEAEMRPSATEAHMRIGAPGDVEPVGIRKYRLVVVR